MTPERITDEEREVIHQEFKEGRLPGWMFKRILDSERHAWAALEEAQQQLDKAIDKPRLLADLHAKMDRFEGERQRGVAGAVGMIESGKYDLGVYK